MITVGIVPALHADDEKEAIVNSVTFHGNEYE